MTLRLCWLLFDTGLIYRTRNHRKTLVAGLMEAQGRLPGDIDKKLLSDNTMIQRKRRLALVNSIRDKEKYAPRGFFTTKLMSPRNLKRIARDISLLECRPFAALVFDKLPRELRDQVYDYLWQGVDADFLDREISCVPEFFHRNDDNEWVLRAPFYAAADFVGPHFAREAALWYFQKLTNAEVDYKAVHDFLRMKEFGNQAFTPVTTLRTLNIALDWDISNRSKENYYIDQDALRFNLQSLLTLKPHEDFSVVLYLDRNLQFSREMFHALETIRPIYHDVVKSGLNFKVLGFRFFTPAWRRNGSKKVTRPIKATSEQLNHYFEMNPEDWLVLIGKELNQIKQRDRRRACQQVSQTQVSGVIVN